MRSVRNIVCLAAVGGVLLGGEAVFAQNDGPLEEIIVTGLRVPISLNDAGTSITVIGREEIEERQEIAVAELLRQTAGIAITNSGGLGKVTALRLRGAESGQTLVLINGVRVNDLSAPQGEFDFSGLTTADIERIEVIRGAQSTLYGSDAMGGVINIVTKDGRGGSGLSASAEGGSYGTFRGSATARGGNRRLNGSATVAYTYSDGFSVADKANGNTEKDNFENLTVTGRVDAEAMEGLRLGGFVRYVDSEAETDSFDFVFGVADGDEGQESENLQLSTEAEATLLDGRLTGLARVSWANIDRTSLVAGEASFVADSERRTIELLASGRPVDEVTLLAGAEFEDNDIRTESFGAFASVLEGSSETDSVFGEARVEPLEGASFSLGVRHDDHSAFGGATTFRATGRIGLGQSGAALRGSWAEGFKAPTLFQLFSDFGDPTLQPEESRGFDIGLIFAREGTSLSASFFRRRVKNQIDFSFATFRFANLLRTAAKGVEIEARQRLADGLVLAANYTYLKAIDRETGGVRLRRPKHSANAQLSWAVTGRFDLSAGLNYTGRQLDTVGFLDDFVVVDLRGSYSVSERVQLFARIENLFDADYQEILGYQTAGISGYGGVRISY